MARRNRGGERRMTSGAWRSLPATPDQHDYIHDLCRKTEVDPHIPPGLNRGDASDLIDHLQAILDGNKPPGSTPPLMAMYADRKTVQDYRRSQKRQFGERVQRAAPEGKGRHGKVWKRHPNVMQGVNRIVYGWAWRCSHPDHRTPTGSHAGRYSWGQAVDRLDEHNRKFHS